MRRGFRLSRRDLLAHRGASAIIPGETQPPAVHALAHAMNAVARQCRHDGGLHRSDRGGARRSDRVPARTRGRVGWTARSAPLIIFGGNPVYNAPVDLGLQPSSDRASASRSTFRCMRTRPPHARDGSFRERHFLEDWGDARAYDGTVTILQPLIQPLYRSWSSTGDAGRARAPARAPGL